MSSRENMDAARPCQEVASIVVNAFLEHLDDAAAAELGRGLAVLLKRLTLLADAALIPHGFSTDHAGVAAMYGLRTEDSARTLLGRNKVPWTKPGESRIYSTDDVAQKGGDV